MSEQLKKHKSANFSINSGAYMKLWNQKKRIIKFEYDLCIVVKNNW